MRTVIRGLGELCITAGVVLVLFVTYELWGTGQYTQDQQDRLATQLLDRWKAAPRDVTTEKVDLGSGLARLRVPEFGDDYGFVIVEGVQADDLRKGPGHYPGSALPGEVGNFVVSGHRTTYSAPFNDLGELERGDEILIDTRDEQYVYTVTGRDIVDPSDVEVTAPVPYHPGERPTERVITLTTCHPKYSDAERMIVFGKLTEERPRVRSAAASSGSSGSSGD